uniref:Uncharacterized protein n=1 Tax=Branchiostoma floridae TaxID=7739 RepID=C3ZUT2_BRAFL|eukprot:XP_002587666.1 hypothetical protein BRAFLDRAFT_92705 [Branchiostoma floridae]
MQFPLRSNISNCGSCDYNNLTYVKKDWFFGSGSPDTLIVLSLSHNKIVDIEPESFARLGLLRGLFLQNNSLSHLRSDWFHGLTNLTKLFLVSNRLETIPQNAFMSLPKLTSLDMKNNGFMGLPNDFRWVTEHPVAYTLNEHRLLNVHTVQWQALLLSDLSFTQIRVTSLDETKSFTHDDKTIGHVWLKYHMDTDEAKRATSYAYGCGQRRYSSQHINHPYRSPLVLMAVMNGENSVQEDTVIPWCERFWLGTETVSINLSGSKESTMQLAAFTEKNDTTVMLVSVLFDPVSSGAEDSSSDKKLKQANSEKGKKSVTCVLVRGVRLFKSYVFTTKREESHSTNEQSSEIAVNNTESVSVSDSSEEISTIFKPTADVNGTLTPTEQEIDLTSTIRPEPDKEQQHQTLVIVALTVAMGVLVAVMLVRHLVKRRCASQRQDNQDNRNDSPNCYGIPDSDIDPSARTVVPVSGWAIPSGSTVNNPRYHRTSPPTSKHSYWQIPDEFYGYQNTSRQANWCPSSLPMAVMKTDENASQYRRSSLPTDPNPYSQIPDEYYNYQNTARQANWRPSSLPSELNVTYENVGQEENVERWEWQPSDLDSQDDDVTSFYAARAEVALPTLTRTGTKHRHYENPVRRCKSLRNAMTVEVEERAGTCPYERPTGQKSRDMVERGAYDTTPEDWKLYGRCSEYSNNQQHTTCETRDRLGQASRFNDEVLKSNQEDFNTLSYIKNDYFAELRYPSVLDILSLSHNKIEDIESRSFVGLDGLEFLNLKHNLLRHVCADWFHGLTNLEELTLSSNRLDNIEKHAFVSLIKLSYLDLSNNNILYLPTEYNWLPNKAVAYKLGKKALFSAQDPRTRKWQAVLMSDVSFVQVRLSGFGICSMRVDSSTDYFVWLHHDIPTQDIFPKSGYDYICEKLLFSSRVIIRGQTYRPPFVFMVMTEGTQYGNTVIPWCRRFWLGADTARVNLATSKESTVELATITMRKNNKMVRLVSVVFDSFSSNKNGISDLDSPTQTNSTKNVTCVLIRGEKVYRSLLTTTERTKEDSAVHVQLPNNTTSINKTGDDREELLTSNTTVVNKPDDVSLKTNTTTSLPTRDVDAIPTLTQADSTTHADTNTTRTRPSPRASDSSDGLSGSLSGHSGFYPPATLVTDIGGLRCQHSKILTGRFQTSSLTSTTLDIDVRRSSLPSDENPYWQIPDEYYNYQNTSRQANWRPSSLPLTLDVRYENCVQGENVERWEWQLSDLDAQDEDDDVTTFYAARAEVALHEVRNIQTAHALYRSPVRLHKCDLDTNNRDAKIWENALYRRPARLNTCKGYTNRAAEIRKKAGGAVYGAQRIKRLHYQNPIRMTRGQKRKAFCGIKSQNRDNRAYMLTDQLHGFERSRYAPISKSSGDVLKIYYQERDGVRLHKSWSKEISPADESGPASVKKAGARRLSVLRGTCKHIAALLFCMCDNVSKGVSITSLPQRWGRPSTIHKPDFIKGIKISKAGRDRDEFNQAPVATRFDFDPRPPGKRVKKKIQDYNHDALADTGPISSILLYAPRQQDPERQYPHLEELDIVHTEECTTSELPTVLSLPKLAEKIKIEDPDIDETSFHHQLELEMQINPDMREVVEKETRVSRSEICTEFEIDSEGSVLVSGDGTNITRMEEAQRLDYVCDDSNLFLKVSSEGLSTI